MENCTIDHKRGLVLPVCFVPKEDFSQNNKSMFKLVHITGGNGTIKLNKETIIFSAPALFCFNELDEVELLQAFNLVAQAVYFHPRVINDTFQSAEEVRNQNTGTLKHHDYYLVIPFVERACNSSAYMELGPVASKKVSSFFRSMGDELALMESNRWPCRFRAFLLESLFLIQDMITAPKSKEDIDLPVPAEDITNILLYLHANYDKRITIEELTDNFHMNRTTLSAKFRESLGLSIMEYLVKYRIKVALTLLRDTGLPVAEVLNRVGFKDRVHFCRMFKKHTGYTPSSYREKVSNSSLGTVH